MANVYITQCSDAVGLVPLGDSFQITVPIGGTLPSAASLDQSCNSVRLMADSPCTAHISDLVWTLSFGNPTFPDGTLISAAGTPVTPALTGGVQVIQAVTPGSSIYCA